jgi:histidinol-phosphate aminotransferase
MDSKRGFSRRQFVGGAAAAIGYMGLKPTAELYAEERFPFRRRLDDEYDALAHLSSNENPYGPSQSVMEAMEGAWKYSMRYGYPDGDIQSAIAQHHGVPEDHILMGAGSGEILRVVGLTYMDPGSKVIGVEPSYSTVYRHAAGLMAEAITLPLMEDHRQSIPLMIETTKTHHREVGFVYLCTPNNPTGISVTAAETKQLIDNIPQDVPILIDEAYHHFVEDPAYETSVPYVLEGRNVIIARTFSKIYGMAGLRLGYAIARPDIIRRMRDYSTGTVNALVKHGGAAALRDHEAEKWVRDTTLRLRKETVAQVEAMGFEVMPSETNFFMMNAGRPVAEVRNAFREKGVSVGRDFPPMLDWLRVSIGTEEEMERFMTGLKEIY